MNYKLVVCDMDGTLLTSNHRISDYTADIIKKIEDNGIKFMIATGRPYLDARHYRDSLELKSYLITSNGARAHDEDNNPIVVENIPKEYVKRLLAYNVGKDIHRNIYLNDDWIIEYEIDGLVEFHKESGYGFNIDDLNKYENEEVAKVFFLGKNEDIENLEKNMEKEFQNDLSITVSSPFCLEFMKKGVNKAETLKKVLKLLNIKPEEVIAFGDSMNDYEMLSLVGKPFIMGNGNKRLMEALPNVEVVGNNNEDGIGEKLQEIFDTIL
ncbi:Cof-type HAD-IIB family hydrolase [Fusobacterium hwasookii]|uniref:HAD superfamily hydrolase n=1 Tax=Fusobacterium hwasookii ChDC F128 TaxID=1216362 RepID=A0ABN0H011_9FUSO|nr:Cof-type HAD-IIB family hydrolase [Fusobacterium hwasookii]EJU07523.1 HAD superfamily hydrolase [Fusobacterium hwasookii ChDC F128]QNE65711.1 Cof-type HAD-IIB family hydrolase [Fusobacterium hwasookii]